MSAVQWFVLPRYHHDQARQIHLGGMLRAEETRKEERARILASEIAHACDVLSLQLYLVEVYSVYGTDKRTTSTTTAARTS